MYRAIFAHLGEGCSQDVHLGEVRGLSRLVLGDLVHRVLAALLALAVGPPLLRNVHHLLTNVYVKPIRKRHEKYRTPSGVFVASRREM